MSKSKCTREFVFDQPSLPKKKILHTLPLGTDVGKRILKEWKRKKYRPARFLRRIGKKRNKITWYGWRVFIGRVSSQNDSSVQGLETTRRVSRPCPPMTARFFVTPPTYLSVRRMTTIMYEANLAIITTTYGLWRKNTPWT